MKEAHPERSGMRFFVSIKIMSSTPDIVISKPAADHLLTE